MSGNAIDPAHLTQAWLHAHEEDTPTSTVYRPAHFPFRPSRGRKGFQLRPDGSLALRQPGPADQTETADGTWKLAGRNLELNGPGGTQTLCIEALEPERMVVSKNQTCAQ
jgi:hypothetical protein